MENNVVKLEIFNSVAHITINRPQVLNALNRRVLSQLYDCCKELEENIQHKCSVVVLAGEGDKAFVAGADISEMVGLTPIEAAEFSQLGSKVFSALENLPQIVIGKIQGFALGGGLELALACDFLVSSDTATFGFPEVSLGLIPGFGGTQRFAQKCGTARALEWISSARKYDALQALQIGLINHVVPASELQEFVNHIARDIASRSSFAINAAKKLVKLSKDSYVQSGCLTESAKFGLCFNHQDSAEGMKAFAEKRKPLFFNQ